MPKRTLTAAVAALTSCSVAAQDMAADFSARHFALANTGTGRFDIAAADIALALPSLSPPEARIESGSMIAGTLVLPPLAADTTPLDPGSMAGQMVVLPAFAGVEALVSAGRNEILPSAPVPPPLAGPSAENAEELAATRITAPPAGLGGGRIIGKDSEVLAKALGGPVLRLTMRGNSVPVKASVSPMEGGCAASLAAHAPSGGPVWSRLLRWNDVAWSGSDAQGQVTVAFYEPEGRLAVDTISFAPGDAQAFHAALGRVVANCRKASGQGDRILIDKRERTRSCYFPRSPQIQLHDSPLGNDSRYPRRAVVTVISQENPEAEIQLIFERGEAQAPGTSGDGWARPMVAFIYADRRLAEKRIASATFALDGAAVPARHSLVAFGDTRVRIAMDPFDANSGAGNGETFYDRLVRSEGATLTLNDGGPSPRAVLHFDTGPVLDEARRALAAADWSCETAAAMPIPAAEWRRQG